MQSREAVLLNEIRARALTCADAETARTWFFEAPAGSPAEAVYKELWDWYACAQGGSHAGVNYQRFWEKLPCVHATSSGDTCTGTEHPVMWSCVRPGARNAEATTMARHEARQRAEAKAADCTNVHAARRLCYQAPKGSVERSVYETRWMELHLRDS